MNMRGVEGHCKRTRKMQKKEKKKDCKIAKGIHTNVVHFQVLAWANGDD